MADVIVSLIIAILFFLALIHMIRRKKAGGSCAGCSHAEQCMHKNEGKRCGDCKKQP